MRVNFFRVGFFCLLAVFVLAGCNGNKIQGLVPVSGNVKYNGAAVEGVVVVFNPVETSDPASRMASGATDANGNFTLTTLGSDGTLPGKYQVTFSKKTIPASLSSEEQDKLIAEGKPIPPPDSKTVYHIPKKYDLTSTSGTEFTVEKGGSKNADFELKD